MAQISIETNDIDIQSSKISEENGSLFVIAAGLTTEFVPLEVMEQCHDTFDNKEVRFRHRLPEENVKDLIGHIHETWVENEKIMFLFEVWGHRDDLKEIQEKIKNNEYSISAGYKKTVDNGVIVDIYGRELSVTPFPKCSAESGCGITTIVQNEKDDKKMANTEELYQELEKTIKKQNSERGEKIIELEATIEVLEDKVLSSNQKITELNEENESLKEKITELETQIVDGETASLRQKIVELEGIKDKEAVQKELEDLKSFSKVQLESQIVRLERAIQINAIGDRQQPVFRQDTEGVDENEDDDPVAFALKMNPNLKNEVPMPKGFNTEGKVPLL